MRREPVSPGVEIRFLYLLMRLRVNGEHRETQAETLEGLIEELELSPQGVAAEVNLTVISKKDYASCRLKDGDCVEIVRFVGGG